mmetsp:Transcript_22066/g.70467  ORF Transcript_22066/g.70467 Transcript_22066/m.70467 type:complete len:459 (-) Transcript_22066:878-2254(-)
MPPVAAGDAAKWALLLRQLGTTSSMEEAVVFAVENPGKADEFVAAAVSWMRVNAGLRMRILMAIDQICARASAAPSADASGSRPAFVNAVRAYMTLMFKALLLRDGPTQPPADMTVRVRKLLQKWEKRGTFSAAELGDARSLLDAAEGTAPVTAQPTDRGARHEEEAGIRPGSSGGDISARGGRIAGGGSGGGGRSGGRGGGGGGGANSSGSGGGRSGPSRGSTHEGGATGRGGGDSPHGEPARSVGRVSLPPTPPGAVSEAPAPVAGSTAADGGAAPARREARKPASADESTAAARFKKAVETERAENKRKKIEARLRPPGETPDEEAVAAWEAMRPPARGEIFVLEVVASPFGSCYEFEPYWPLARGSAEVGARVWADTAYDPLLARLQSPPELPSSDWFVPDGREEEHIAWVSSTESSPDMPHQSPPVAVRSAPRSPSALAPPHTPRKARCRGRE